MKNAFLWLIAGLVAIETSGQETKAPAKERSFLAFSAGVSVPILCYGSSNISKNTSGFAKAGFTLDLSYGYRFGQNLGVAGMLFYSSNNTGRNVVQASGNGRFRYMGLLAGPMLSAKFSEKAYGDIRFVAGIARAWSPQLSYNGETILNRDASTTFAWSAGAGFRYNLSGKTFLQIKADHAQLKPPFRGPATGENVKNEQHIVVMNFDAGIGIRL
jgi:hypothetical protein